MNNWIYSANKDNTVRFLLGEKGKKNLICIGINPSTATPEKLDKTIITLRKIANLNGYDGWLMINVYPQRDTYPYNIHDKQLNELIELNKSEINRILSESNYQDVWAAWGNEINRRPYLLDCLKEIRNLFDKKYHWIHYSNPTKYQNPRHPSRLGYNDTFTNFDIDNYLLLKQSGKKIN